ncbi:ABC transporter permease [Nocardia grenadensis]|uniref:ABC transporter permease n=2 Tax=Nocardia grenadensis TaxID=931537 RepID=UPI003D72ED80
MIPTDQAIAATPAAASDSAVVSRKFSGWPRLLQRYGLLLLLVAMALMFAVLPESGAAFRSEANLRALVANQAVGLVVALALLFPMAAGFLDFSVGAVTATTSVAAAAAMAHFGLPPLVAICIALLGGVAVGGFIGLLVAKFEMNPFIATLGMATLLGGVILAYTDGLQITNGISPQVTALGSGTWFGLPRIVVVAAAIAFGVWFVMEHTPLGRYLFAVGSNSNAARLTGINVVKVKFISFALSGLVAGAAGALLLARQGSATSDSGMSMLFPALTAVLLSTIVVYLGRPSVLGTVIGVLFLAVSVSGLTLIGAPAWVGQFFNGAALLVAVGVSSVGNISRSRARAG